MCVFSDCLSLYKIRQIETFDKLFNEEGVFIIILFIYVCLSFVCKTFLYKIIQSSLTYLPQFIKIVKILCIQSYF